ncbi:hypothetical protein ACWOAH_03430 [Vagococcus vulneris]|uniref:Uncharacterized protein n=1 Tax=Vagococcus vulneris TaxID=1977869 RepID=A0A429ZWN9_9ENTE|nr:hypothetical protein [Vagococcus vulneris]RST98116.1 hypothetical protein CBF37_08770 [Vagococcus vulneris]
MSEKKRMLIVTAVLISLFVLGAFIVPNKLNWLNLIVILICYPASFYMMKHRVNKISTMFDLADQLGISTSELSRVTGIGTIDLDCARPVTVNSYVPPMKQVEKGLDYLYDKVAKTEISVEK